MCGEPVFNDYYPPEFLFGFIAILLSTGAFLRYALEILNGRCAPQRSTWMVWAFLASISAAAHVSGGQTYASAFIIAQAAETCIVSVLAIIYGKGGRFTALDWVVLGSAGVGLVVWYLSGVAAYALAVSISLSALAATPTVLRTF